MHGVIGEVLGRSYCPLWSNDYLLIRVGVAIITALRLSATTALTKNYARKKKNRLI